MSKLPLITVPNSLLRQQSKPVDLTDPNIIQFIKEMADTLVKKSDPPGVGLSAVQVGKLWQILLLYLPSNYNSELSPKDSAHSELTLIANPKIISISTQLTLGPNPKKPLLEGCLSIPHLYSPVLRPTWVDIKYESLDLNTRNPQPATFKSRFEGFSARVYLHEADHFEGVLFTDHALKQKQTIYFDTGETFEPVLNPEAIITW